MMIRHGEQNLEQYIKITTNSPFEIKFSYSELEVGVHCCVMDGFESDPTRVQGLYTIHSCNILFVVVEPFIYALYV
jgi:hypothetical protein